jgi:hypothetical protein
MNPVAAIIFGLLEVLKIALQAAQRDGSLDELEAARVAADLIELQRFGKSSRDAKG